MTTTADDRKMTPIEAIAIVRAFRTDLEQWDKFLGSRWLTQQRELDEDFGELARLAGSSRKLLGVLDTFGDNPALNDNAVDTMRGWSNAFIKRAPNNLRPGYCERLAPALDAIESGLRALVGAKAAAEPHSEKPVLTIHVADLTATLGANQRKFDQSRQWEALKKLAQRPGSAVAMSAAQASRLRKMLQPDLEVVAEAIYCVHAGRYAIRTSNLLVKVIDPQVVEN